ncbi:hypothetical protein BS50DRAFT_569171 [Corynespora cassiicola Philippines]|uniref:Uncharacterized protein n=1 Tax=Corynespora cassiicola Philippines TaxID=1448308 RepID=A0A2T2P7P7_CORCC|nr:hypothetical protein BS50DRAFT_569171 [Corynespora cassiicola Philippines]
MMEYGWSAKSTKSVTRARPQHDLQHHERHQEHQSYNRRAMEKKRFSMVDNPLRKV